MIQEYASYLRSIKGYSENTIKAYSRDLREFVSYLQAHRAAARWSNVTMSEIDDFVTSQAERGMKPATTNRQLAAISGIYNYMKRQGMLSENPCKYESRRKIGHRLPNTIPAADLSVAYENAEGVTKLMIGILATTGIRIQELLQLTWEDVNTTTGEMRINGKGGKQRIVYSQQYILKELREVERLGEQRGRMFYIEQREARMMIYEALRPYSKARQLSPHAIRHTLATTMAANGTNVTTIASILGHTDIRTTQKYIDMTQMGTREALQQASVIK